jgi:hypothetical protein
MASSGKAASAARACEKSRSHCCHVRGCSVDKTTGNVAALIQYDNFTFAVAILPEFTGTPQLYTDSKIYRFLSVGYDGNGNLFLLGAPPGSSTYDLAELPSGGSSFESISLSLPPNATQLKTVQWDGTYVTLEGVLKNERRSRTWPQAVFQLSISGSEASVANTIILQAFRSYRLAQQTTSSIVPSLNVLVLADSGPIRIFNYPAGGKEIKKLVTGQGRAEMATVALPTSR